jgi:hypothetical protein
MGLAGDNGAAGMTAGTAGMGLAGDNGAAGATAGTNGTAGAAGTTAGTNGTAGAAGTTAGTNGTAGTTAGTNGTAGTTAGSNGTAGTTAGTNGTAGAAGTTAGTNGTAGAAGTTAGTGGAAGTAPLPNLDGCNHVNWIFTPEYVCDPATNPSCNFQATARDPAGAIDGDPTTRYTDGRTQAGGEYVTLNFQSSIKVNGISIVANPATDAAKAYKVEYSTDTMNYVAFNPAVAGTGGVSPQNIAFPTGSVLRAIKITQTGAVVAPATSWWSINEITLTGCVDQ